MGRLLPPRRVEAGAALAAPAPRLKKVILRNEATEFVKDKNLKVAKPTGGHAFAAGRCSRPSDLGDDFVEARPSRWLIRASTP